MGLAENPPTAGDTPQLLTRPDHNPFLRHEALKSLDAVSRAKQRKLG